MTKSYGDKFLNDFHHVATIGATPRHGLNRQAATTEDADVRLWLTEQITAAGWKVRIDGIGNVFGCVEWTPGAPYVLIGSHLDSQPLGGRFDGAYGVIAALHAAQRVDERVRERRSLPKFNLAVVDWFNEEGGRFAPSIMGSSVFAGLFDEDRMLQVKDHSGVAVRDALRRIGYLGTDTRPTVAAYAEIHIEQGPILERENIAIGLVESSWYTQKLDIDVLGEQSHTGATAMAARRDALVAAAEIVLKVREVTSQFPDETLVSSVGQFDVEPDSPIVVPRRVHMVADLRSGAPATVQSARATLIRQIKAIADRYDLQIDVSDFDIRPIRTFPEDGVSLSEKAAAGLGLSTRRMATMAGHDSVSLNTMTPAVMLFVPSVAGLSHCERELTEDGDMVAGLDLFTEVTDELVHGALAHLNRHDLYPKK